MLRGLVLIAMIAAIAWYSFMQGRDRAEARIEELVVQVTELDQTTLSAREEAASARAEIAAHERHMVRVRASVDDLEARILTIRDSL